MFSPDLYSRTLKVVAADRPDFYLTSGDDFSVDTVTECHTLQVPYLALVAQNARNRFFPQPAPDGFYSGNTEQVAGIGLLRNCYAWEWGDALFVTLDPYWSSPVPVDNAFGDDDAGSGKASDR